MFELKEISWDSFLEGPEDVENVLSLRNILLIRKEASEILGQEEIEHLKIGLDQVWIENCQLITSYYVVNLGIEFEIVLVEDFC